MTLTLAQLEVSVRRASPRLFLALYKQQRCVPSACTAVALKKTSHYLLTNQHTLKHTHTHAHNAVCCPSGRMSNLLIQHWQGQGPQHNEAHRAAFWESEENKYES